MLDFIATSNGKSLKNTAGRLIWYYLQKENSEVLVINAFSDRFCETSGGKSIRKY